MKKGTYTCTSKKEELQIKVFSFIHYALGGATPRAYPSRSKSPQTVEMNTNPANSTGAPQPQQTDIRPPVQQGPVLNEPPPALRRARTEPPLRRGKLNLFPITLKKERRADSI